MEKKFIEKNGLLYSLDMKTIIGVDDTSCEFAGKIPYGAKSINDDVFSECPYKFMIMPDSVINLGNRVLENSTALEQVKLPAFLTKLPEYLFSGCTALTTITMPNITEDFPEGLFQNCKSLKEIPFRAGLKVLHKNVFKGCKSLKTLVIPDSVKKIEAFAIADCISLESVIFPPIIEYIDENAFFGCNSLRTIRIDSENPFYYINDEGNLCLRSNDRPVVKVIKNTEKNIKFFDENLCDKDFDEEKHFDSEIEGAFFLSEEEIFEDNDVFYGLEIGANDEELENFENNDEQNTVRNNKESEETKMVDENNVNSMLADIMNTEKKDTSVSENVSVGTQELEVLAHTMSVMKDSSQTSVKSKVSNDELERLFAKNEENVLASQKSGDISGETDPKIQILVDSVGFGKILTFEPKEDVPEDPDLFVIAENLFTDAQGNADFSPKLISCCKTFARIHDFKHIVLLNGLPFDNEEFLQFFHHFIVKKNVVLACSAASPSELSDYCKKICEEARISLNSNDLNEQRKKISIKTDTLIKLVIKDQVQC